MSPTSAQLAEALNASAEDMSSIQPNFFGMFYGPQGAGKTVASLELAQAITPKDRTILYVDTGQNWVSVLNHRSELRSRTSRLAYQGLSQLSAISTVVSTGTGNFSNVGCVILDEHSTMAQLDLDKVTTARAEKDSEKDPDTPAWPDMNTNINKVRKALYDLISARVHLILVSSEKIEKGISSPNYLPKAVSRISEPLHAVWHLTATERQTEGPEVIYIRSAQCHPSKLVTAKSRVGGLALRQSVDSLPKAVVYWLGKGGELAPMREVEVLPQEKLPTDDEHIEGMINVP